jgi:uncharacterized membrane protein
LDVLPIVIIAAVVIPLLVVAFLAARRSRAAGENVAEEDEQARARTEQEFAESEAYQEEWRKHERRADTLL